MIALYLTFPVMITVGCTQKDKPLQDEKIPAISTQIKNLCQQWRHSIEEQKDSDAQELLFRPAGSRIFPPSRFRMAYKFASNGDCELLDLHPADRHYFKPAKWTFNATGGESIKILADGKTKSYRIIELTNDILRLAPVALQAKP